MKDSDKDFVEYLQDLLGKSYVSAEPHFRRMEYLQRLYDGDMDPGEFGTMSEIYFPVYRTGVKKAVADAVQFAFPANGMAKFVPVSDDVRYDDIRKAERLVDHVLTYKMRAKFHSIPAIQDAVKFGCGYSIIENKMVSKAGSVGLQMLSGNTSGTTRQMMVKSQPEIVPTLRHLSYECVIPTPDGSTVEECSCVMVVDYYRADEFRALYEMNTISGDTIYKGSPEKIIQDSVDNKLDGTFPHWWNVLRMSGETTDSLTMKYFNTMNIASSTVGDDRYKVVYVPVVKYFFNDEHVWLANGTTIIFHDKDSYETMRKPVLKASVDLDSNNWWALSDMAAARDIAYGINSYANSMMDLMSNVLRPMLVYDASRYGGEGSPRYEPWGVIPINGKVQDAFSVAQSPPVPNGLPQFGEYMNNQLDIASMNPFGGQASPGLVRGGSFAFESLLQTQNAPRELMGMVLDMGYIEPLIMQTLVALQTMPKEEYEYIELKESEMRANRMSLDDIRYGFEVAPDMTQKLRNSLNERMADITMYQQVYRNNPWIRQKQALDLVIDDKRKAEALIKTNEEYVEDMKKQQEAMQQQQTQQAPMTQGRQV